MPTYEYQCDACGHQFEQFQSIKADPIKVCPKCKKRKVHRLISAGGGLIFKGSGFYITDYRDGGYAEKAKADTGDAKGGETKSEATGDAAKPAETKGGGEKKSEGKAAAEAPKPAAKESKPAKSKSGKSGDAG